MKKTALGSTEGILGLPGNSFANSTKTEISGLYNATLPTDKIKSVKANATATKLVN